MDARPWIRNYPDGVPADVGWESMPLDRVVRRTTMRYPERAALVFFDHRIPYRELDAEIDRLAAGLQALGVGKGDRVLLFMPNCPQMVMTYVAVWRIGAVAVPANPVYTAAELAHEARDSGAETVVVLSMLYERTRQIRDETPLKRVIVTNIKEYFRGPTRALFTLLKERSGGHRVDITGEPDTYWFKDVLAMGDRPDPVDVEPSDLAALLYTGGTTGVPKGAALTHENLMANAAQIAAWAPHLVEGREIMLTALPLAHAYSLTVCMMYSLLRGFTQILVPDARDLVTILKVIDHHKPTIFPGVPTLYNAISRHRHVVDKKYDLTSITTCLSGAAALPPDVKQRFEAVTGGRLVEGYGLSEASPVTHANPLDGSDRIGMIGLPLPGTDCKIVDEATETVTLGPHERGVLCVAGPQVMVGYWNRPDETAQVIIEEGGKRWLHTGDVAVMDGDGFFQIVDRKKDMILSSEGFNIYPREVEDVLFEHPGVAEAGVIGVPPDGHRQRVKAFVVRAEGSKVTEEELKAFCRERLARYKVPSEIEFRDDLPKSFVGKVLRRELAADEILRS